MAVTASITPGAVVTENSKITVSLLNQIANPTVDLSGSIQGLSLGNNAVYDANVNASAAIQFSKLATLSTGQLIVGNAGTPTAATISGDVTVAADGVVTIADNAVTAAKLAVGAALPTGSITQYAGSATPSGWLLANGDATLNTFTYKDLHAVISNTYGGTAYEAGVTDQDGVSTTFTLPDLRGRIPVGVGQQTSGKWDSAEEDYSGSGTNFALAATGGTEDHKLLEAEIPSHDHGMPTGSNQMRTTTNTSGGTNDNATSGGGSVGKETFTAFGGTSTHNNLQPYIALNYIIKT